jgi:phosphotransferase system IIB component
MRGKNCLNCYWGQWEDKDFDYIKSIEVCKKCVRFSEHKNLEVSKRKGAIECLENNGVKQYVENVSTLNAVVDAIGSLHSN